MNDICCIGHITKDKIITLGSNGSLIFADGEFHDIPAYRPGEMVDECLMEGVSKVRFLAHSFFFMQLSSLF